MLEPEELTILTAWAEALAEALTFAPARLEAVAADAHAGSSWRAALGIPEPSPQLDQAIDSIDRAIQTATVAGPAPTTEAVLAMIGDPQPSERALDGLARRVLRSALEQRQTRHAPCRDLHRYSSPAS